MKRLARLRVKVPNTMSLSTSRVEGNTSKSFILCFFRLLLLLLLLLLLWQSLLWLLLLLLLLSWLPFLRRGIAAASSSATAAAKCPGVDRLLRRTAAKCSDTRGSAPEEAAVRLLPCSFRLHRTGFGEL